MTWLFVGLGNPGPTYRNHRHNVGFQVLDVLAAHFSFPDFKRKDTYAFTTGTIAAASVLCLKPLTYMNRSGLSVGQVARFYKIPLEQILVIHDDLDLAPGKIRLKLGGGTGGHRGLQSLDQSVGKNYWRLRIGIGHPGHRDEVNAYVLQDFSSREQAWLALLKDFIAEEISAILQQEGDLFVSRVMQRLKNAGFENGNFKQEA